MTLLFLARGDSLSGLSALLILRFNGDSLPLGSRVPVPACFYSIEENHRAVDLQCASQMEKTVDVPRSPFKILIASPSGLPPSQVLYFPLSFIRIHALPVSDSCAYS